MYNWAKWVKQFIDYGAAITENESYLIVKLALKGTVDKSYIFSVLTNKNPWIQNVDVYIETSSGQRMEFIKEENDFSISGEIVLCEEHGNTWGKFYNDQVEGFSINDWRRLDLICSTANCGDCGHNYSLVLSMKKNVFLMSLYKDKLGYDLNINGINLSIWYSLEECRKAFVPSKIVISSSKPLLIICDNVRNVRCAYISIINIRSDSLVQLVENEVNFLKEKITFLSKGKHIIAPPEFYVDDSLIYLKKPPNELSKIINFGTCFLLSILSEISIFEKIDNQTYKFSIQREHEIVVVVSDIDNNNIVINEQEYDISKYDDILINIYLNLIHGKKHKSNKKLIQNALIMAGKAQLESVLLYSEDIIRYYNFQYENLLEDKFKEQYEVVKTFIVSSQNIRNNISSTVDSLIKNIASVIVVALGIGFGILFVLGSKVNLPVFIYNYLYFASFGYVIFYIPLYSFQVIKLIEMTNKSIDVYYNDLKIISKIYDYPLFNLVQDKNYIYEQKSELSKIFLWGIIWLSLFYLLGFLVMLLVLNKGYEQNVLSSIVTRCELMSISSVLSLLPTIFILKKGYKVKKLLSETGESV